MPTMSFADIRKVETELNDLKSFWGYRQKAVKKWTDLRALKDEYERPGLESLVSNDPKTFFDLSLFFLSNRPARHRIPISTQNSIQIDRGGMSERAVTSIWREKDRSQLRRGKGNWLREVSDLLLHMGWISVFAALLKDKDSNPLFTAEIWNPMHTFPWWDEDCLGKVIHEYPTTVKSINDKIARLNWSGSISGSDSTTIYVVDIWRNIKGTITNQVFVREKPLTDKYPDFYIPSSASGSSVMQIIKQETTHDELHEIPVIVSPVAGWADRGGIDSGNTQWQDRCYEGLLETNAQLYRAHNRWLTFLMQNAKDVVNPIVLASTDSGKPIITKEDVEQKKIVHLKHNEGVAPLHLGGDYKEAMVMMSNLDSMIQRGSYPWIFFGAVPFEMSGFAISQLLSYALAKVGPYAQALEATLSAIDFTWLDSYKKSDMKPIKIAGNSKISSHDYFVQDFSPADVPDMVYVEATIPLSLPTDILQRVTLARQLIPEGQILDSTTVLDRFLEEQDPELIRQRISEDKLNNSPVIQGARLLVSLRDKMAYYKEKGMEQEYAIVAQAFNAILNELGTTPAVTAYPSKAGVPPQALPGEMTNISSDQVKAALGSGIPTPPKSTANMQTPMSPNPPGPQPSTP